MNNFTNKQQGIAIITVLLIVAFITAAITLLLDKQNLILDNTKLLARQQKAINYFLSAKSITINQLLKDKDLNYDSEDEEWYKDYIEFNSYLSSIGVDGVKINNKLTPLSSKVNINNFIKIDKGQVKIRSNPNFNTCLIKLTSKLNISPIGDYIINYINLQQPKTLINTINKLKNIEGITTNDYYKIKPYIFALGEVVKININTASAEILECLHYDLGEFNAKEIIKNRPFKSISKAKEELQEQLPGLEKKDIDDYFNNLIDIKSKYFLLDTKINLGDLILNAKAILKRENGKITTQNQEFSFELK